MVNLAEPLPVLADYPIGLRQASITHGRGDLEDRLHACLNLRHTLEAGKCDVNPLFAPILTAISELNLPRYSSGRAALAEQVVLSALWHLDTIAYYQDRFHEDERAASLRASAAFKSDWHSISQDFEAVYAIFEDLGGLANAFSASGLNALLKSTGWQGVLAAHKLIAKLPELTALIARLGRRQHESPERTDEFESRSERHDITRHTSVDTATKVASSAGESAQVRPAQMLATMLASEAVAMRHPILKKRWRAQFVAHELLCYERELDLPSPQSHPQVVQETRNIKVPKPKTRRGPMIVCVDTSASMQGGKELIAKAAVLEAMQQARRDARPCYLYCFSGPENISEHELSLNAEGLAALTHFMEGSFHGGTDFTEPLSRAIRQVQEQAWAEADILIASDGEFGVVREVAEMVYQLKREQGLHIASLLIADRETIGLLEICGDIVWLKNWRDFDPVLCGAWQPVHDKSLTKQYFPYALQHRMAPDASINTAQAV